MERHSELQPRTERDQPLLVARKTGPATPFNAGDVLAVVFEQYPGPIPRRWRGRLGRSAKELLEDGFDPNVVCAAIFAAISSARPGMADKFAVEIDQAGRGSHWSWRTWQGALLEHSGSSDPTTRAVSDALKAAMKGTR